MPEAGWYDDPLVPGGKRYWDGNAWTPTAQGPAQAPAGPTPNPTPGQGPTPNPMGSAPALPASSAPGTGAVQGHTPPFEPIPAAVASTGGFMSGGGFGDIGEWIHQTFRALRDNAVEVLLLFFMFPAVFWCIGYLALHQFLAELDWDIGGRVNDGIDGFSGVNESLAILSVAAFAAMFIAWLVGMVAGHHLLYGAHSGENPSVGRSVGVGIKRLPRLLAISLLLIVGYAVLLSIPPALITFGLSAGGSTAVGVIVVALIVGLILTCAFVWLWVKTAFIWVAVAVVPRGTSALGSSFGLSRGRFWQTLARLGILFAMTTMFASVIQIFLQFAAPVLLFSKFDLDNQDRLFVNGQNIDTIDDLQLADLLPNPFVAVGYFTIFVLISAIAQAVVASGTSALYASTNRRDSVGGGIDNLGPARPFS